MLTACRRQLKKENKKRLNVSKRKENFLLENNSVGKVVGIIF